MAKDFLNLPKWRNFTESGHTASKYKTLTIYGL